MAGGLDFNDAAPAARPSYDLDRLSDALAATADKWAPALFPRGRISDDKAELRLANIKGQPPRNTGSCVVSLRGERAGSFFDFDGGASGGPLATVKEATGLSGRPLLDRAAELAQFKPNGHGTMPPWKRAPASKAIDPSQEVAHIVSRSVPAPGTLVDNYLASRHLMTPTGPDLQFCGNVSDFKNGVGRPAMIGVVRGADGKPTGGLHRTFLAYDGHGKADMEAPRKMLGPIQNGAVRLMPVGADGALGVAEGIETAIAASILHHVPVWACLAAGNLGGTDKSGAWTGFELPTDISVRHLIIFADRGNAGEKAAEALRARIMPSGIAVEILLPETVDDFNGDLLGAERFFEAKPSENQIQQPEMLTPSASAAELNQFIAQLTPKTSHDIIQEALRLIVVTRPNAIAFRQLVVEVKDRTKIPVKALEEVLTELKRANPAPVSISTERAKTAAQDWMGNIILTESGEAKALLENAAVALEQAPEWKGVIWLDTFGERIVLRRPPPWLEDGEAFAERTWTDNDDYMATRWLQRAGISISTPITHEAVLSAGFRNHYHPVCEYLDTLIWDNSPRLDTWLSDHLGVDDTPYSRAVGARWMISAVARVRQPGIKVDHMLILEGPQERGKSTALRALFDPWFSDGMSELGSKDAAIELAGVWLIEFAELDAMRRVERNRLKAFITRASDRYRPPWGRHAMDHPRQMVFAGSVNDETYLDDPTGGRRFWPVKIGMITIETLWQERDQLWAEAAHRYNAGEKFYLHEADLKADAFEQQTQRQIEDAWHARIRKFLDGDVDNTFPKNSASVEIVLAGINLQIDRWDRIAQNRVVAYFTLHKWERRVTERGGDAWYFRPGA